jgi:hypothetical protein
MKTDEDTPTKVYKEFVKATLGGREGYQKNLYMHLAIRDLHNEGE